MRLRRFHAHGITTFPPGARFAEVSDSMSGKLFFVVDVSLSMEGARLRGAVRGARDLLHHALDESYLVGVIAFNDSARVVQDLTDDGRPVDRALSRLRARSGTDLAKGIALGHRLLAERRGERVLALFTDGETDRAAALRAARAARRDGIKIIATIGGTADQAFMNKVVSEGTDVVSSPDDKVEQQIVRLGRFIGPTYRR